MIALAAVLLAAVLVTAPPAAAQTDPLQALRGSCATKLSKDPKPRPRVRYRECTDKVASFDGTELDATLTLPAKATKRRLPLLVFLHGFLSHKG